MEPQTPSSDHPPRWQSHSPLHPQQAAPSKGKDRYWLHLLLFVLSLASTVYAGTTWVGRYLYYEDAGMAAMIVDGFRYAVPLLFFLTVHEFGHYFAARRHNISTSLPYFIPFPFNGIGNFGAVIRIREPIPSTRKLFDVGAAGPLAGFVASVAVLVYAVVTLPGPEYLLDQPGHEALKEFIRETGRFPDEMLQDGEATQAIIVGQTPLFWILSQVVPNMPPMYELYHYPVLFAGWLALFFTALNLLPVGQLDGGHILYALFGHKWHRRLARGFVVMLLISGGIGFMDFMPQLLVEQDMATVARGSWLLLAAIMYFFLHRTFNGNHTLIAPVLLGTLVVIATASLTGLDAYGYTGWFIWTLLIIFLIRIEHPPVVYDEPLTRTQRILGYLSILIFILCFSIQPLSIM